MDWNIQLHSGEIYYPSDDAIMKEQMKCLEKLYDFNQTRPSEMEKRTELLKEMFAEIGENCYIEPPFRANWGGRHCHFGKNVYANFNLTCVDDTHIYVGDCTMFGPNVILATAGHPILGELRVHGYQYNAPIHIGKNCWLGAGAIVMPGVTIGDNVIIGAGAIVTTDVPSDSVAAGIPARVVCTLDEYYQKRKTKALEEAKQYVRELYHYRGVRPTVEDFWEEFALFYHEKEKYPEAFVQRIKNVQMPGELYDEFIKNNKPMYVSFEDFLNDALKNIEK
jgi:galactoside O-acetyltransferase